MATVNFRSKSLRIVKCQIWGQDIGRNFYKGRHRLGSALPTLTFLNSVKMAPPNIVQMKLNLWFSSRPQASAPLPLSFPLFLQPILWPSSTSLCLQQRCVPNVPQSVYIIIWTPCFSKVLPSWLPVTSLTSVYATQALTFCVPATGSFRFQKSHSNAQRRETCWLLGALIYARLVLSAVGMSPDHLPHHPVLISCIALTIVSSFFGLFVCPMFIST